MAQHIAFVVNNYLPKVGGVELHVAGLAKNLADDGVAVTIISLSNVSTINCENNTDVIRLRATPLIGGVLAIPYPGTKHRIRQILRSRNITVVSTHTRFFPMSFIAVRIARKLRLPVVHTEHGSDHVRGVPVLIRSISKVVDLTLGRYVLRQSTKVLAISAAAQKFVCDLARVDSTVFHNAIDTSHFEPRGTIIASRTRIIFLGRLVDGKGWETVLAIGESLIKEFAELEVHFVGDGIRRRNLEEAVLKSPIKDRTTVHGHIDPGKIRELLAGAVLVNPTTLSEGFQTTLLEAVASRASIVSTPVAAAQYLEDNGADVSIVSTMNVDDWIATTGAVMKSPSPRPSRQLLDSFDWSTRSREYLRVLDSLDW